jgi:hypothetical protein
MSPRKKRGIIMLSNVLLPASAATGAAPPPLGEIVTWVSLPRGRTLTHAQLTAALAGAGLNAAAARALSRGNAFRRAVRRLTAADVVRPLPSDDGSLRFQFTAEHLQGAQLDYTYRAVVTLDGATGALTSDDAAMLALAQQRLAECQEARTCGDVTRLVQQLYASEADLFCLRQAGGCYFVPQRHVTFNASMDAFLSAVGGRLSRFTVADSAVSAPAVQVAVSDGLHADLDAYEAALMECRGKPRELLSIKRAQAAIGHALERVVQYRELLGSHYEILIDAAAEVQSRAATHETEAVQTAVATAV